MSASGPVTPPRLPNCPSCGAAMADGAVLCVQCGYHLKLGRKLETSAAAASSGVTTIDPPVPRRPIKKIPEFDLTAGAIKEAEGLVSDAQYVWVAGLLALCFCQPIGPLLAPLYAYRLYQWRNLRNTFEELRYPNAFSPNGKLAAEFEEAQLWLKIGFWLGIGFAAAWALGGAGFAAFWAIVDHQLRNV